MNAKARIGLARIAPCKRMMRVAWLLVDPTKTPVSGAVGNTTGGLIPPRMNRVRWTRSQRSRSLKLSQRHDLRRSTTPTARQVERRVNYVSPRRYVYLAVTRFAKATDRAQAVWHRVAWALTFGHRAR